MVKHTKKQVLSLAMFSVTCDSGIEQKKKILHLPIMSLHGVSEKAYFKVGMYYTTFQKYFNLRLITKLPSLTKTTFFSRVRGEKIVRGLI